MLALLLKKTPHHRSDTHPPSLQKREGPSPTIRMKAAIMSLVLVLSLISTTEAEKDVLGCSADQLIGCIAEIEKAFEDCSHLDSTDEIMVCINDILGATNCEVCLCDVLPFLC